MTTLAALISEVSSDLRDPNNVTFSTAMVTDFVNNALSEVSRISPALIRQDISVTADAMSYTVGSGSREVEVYRVEVWNKTVTPEQFVARLNAASEGRLSQSSTGWEVRGGTLYLTNAQEAGLVAGTHTLRVWGYDIIPQMTGAVTSATLTAEQEWALRDYARLEGIKSLISSRELYAQWQTQSHNTDVGLAALANMYNIANEAWRRRSHQLLVLREAP